MVRRIQAERARAETDLKRARRVCTPPPTREELEQLIGDAGDLVTVLADADASERAALYSALGLRLRYEPDRRRVVVECRPSGQARRSRLLVTVDEEVWHDGTMYDEYYVVQAINLSDRPIRVHRVYIDVSSPKSRQPRLHQVPASPDELVAPGVETAMTVGTKGATIPGTLGPGQAGRTWVPVGAVDELLDGRPPVAVVELPTTERFDSRPRRLHSYRRRAH